MAITICGYYTRRRDARRIARHVFSAHHDIFLKQNKTAYHDFLAKDGWRMMKNLSFLGNVDPAVPIPMVSERSDPRGLGGGIATRPKS